MKLMMVIVQDQDYAKLATRLIQNRIRATKFETSGLRGGRTAGTDTDVHSGKLH